LAGLQSVTTPVTGQLIASAGFGIPVANNLGVLANPPIAKMRNSTTQSIPNSTDTAMTWDTEDYDTVSGHSTVTNSSRYTCQTGYAGYYLVQAMGWWNGNATGSRSIWLKVNGSDLPGSKDGVIPGAGINTSTYTATKVFLNVGDYVEVFVRQNSGGALTTVLDSTAGQSWFEVQWVHQ
jgi:hypothetical protein